MQLFLRQAEVDALIEMTSRLKDERNFLRRQLRSLISDVSSDATNSALVTSQSDLQSHKNSNRNSLTSPTTCSCLLGHLLSSGDTPRGCSHSDSVFAHNASRSTTMTSIGSDVTHFPVTRNRSALNECTCASRSTNISSSKSLGALQVLSRRAPSLFQVTSPQTPSHPLQDLQAHLSTTENIQMRKQRFARARPLSAAEASLYRV